MDYEYWTEITNCFIALHRRAIIRLMIINYAQFFTFGASLSCLLWWIESITISKAFIPYSVSIILSTTLMLLAFMMIFKGHKKLKQLKRLKLLISTGMNHCFISRKQLENYSKYMTGYENMGILFPAPFTSIDLVITIEKNFPWFYLPDNAFMRVHKGVLALIDCQRMYTFCKLNVDLSLRDECENQQFILIFEKAEDALEFKLLT